MKKCISPTSENTDVSRSAIEEEINQLIVPRQLHGLTEDKVKIVEGKE